ncbi:MAG TPA: serine/threonine-protein kinase [Gemmatimonadaceae bacterium]|nr:serine/threonine-protein kinase [Gemmatimonadaceae bacterium]
MNGPDELLWGRWEEIDGLLESALDLPPAGRREFLDAVGARDPELSALLERLLSHEARTGNRFSTPAAALVEGAFGTETDLTPGTVVGRWTIVRRRARGGMATVYEAERADGAYEQRVALKVLRRGLDTEDLVARFLTERQILSSLSHPHIARLLDGGSTSDGRPYLVMELVDGEPITAWADARRLDVPRRLGLFLGVADAVHAAHRQLVVHRDIKPSNVLVDAEGRVRLLDFGIAKLLESDPELTAAGARALTPEYASPEQLRNDPITTASDVYQLGLLLHELLTGQRPETGKAPVRASRAARANGRSAEARRLSGDLDLIIETAVRPESEARYASADEFAADVRRHLRGLPVQAHPESSAYRVRKFVGRNPLVLPVAAAITIALVGFVTVLALQNRRLGEERDAAEAATRRARETQAFFVDLLRSPDPFAPADPERGRAITVVEALELGAARVDEDLGAEPLLRAAMLSTIGDVLGSLGQWAAARDALEEAVALRLAAGDTLVEQFSYDLGRLAGMLSGLGHVDSAIALQRHRLAIERARTPPSPTLLGEALQGLSDRLASVDRNEAVRLHEEAVRVLEPVGGVDYASTVKSLADQYQGAARHADAEATARLAVSAFDSLLGPGHPTTAMALHTLAQAVGSRGRRAEAAVLLDSSLRIFEGRMGPEHPFSSRMRNNLGVLLVETDPRRAEEIFRVEAAVQERLLGAEHPTVGEAMQNRAVALLRLGRTAEAEAQTHEAEAIFRAALPAGSIVVTFPMLTRIEIQLARGNYVAAARTAEAVRTALRGRLPAAHPAMIVADCRLGRALVGQGERTRARSLLAGVLERLGSVEGMREAHRQECMDAWGLVGERP